MVTKTGLMLGLGESWDEVLEAMRLLREADVDVLTIGQYLRPSRQHLPLHKYYTPAEFMSLRRIGLEMGFPTSSPGRWCAPATTPPSRSPAAPRLSRSDRRRSRATHRAGPRPALGRPRHGACAGRRGTSLHPGQRRATPPAWPTAAC